MAPSMHPDRAADFKRARAGIEFLKLAPNDARLPWVFQRAVAAAEPRGCGPDGLRSDRDANLLLIDICRAARATGALPEAERMLPICLSIEAARLAPGAAEPLLAEASSLLPREQQDCKDLRRIFVVGARAEVLDRLLRDPAAVAGDRREIKSFAEQCAVAARASASVDGEEGEIARSLLFDAACAVGGVASLQAAHDQLVAWRGDSSDYVPGERLRVEVLDAAAMVDAARLTALIASSPENRGDPDEDWRHGIVADAVRAACDRAWAILQPATSAFPEDQVMPDVVAAARSLELLGCNRSELPPADMAQYVERCAWGALLAGKPAKAVEWFGAVVNGTIPSPPGGGAPPAARRGVDQLRGLAESQLAANDLPAAFATFRDIASATDPTKEPGAAHAADYFHAWARMLEILDRQADEKPERVQVIAREVRRLRLLKPADACPECAKRIEQVASRRGVGPAAP